MHGTFRTYITVFAASLGLLAGAPSTAQPIDLSEPFCPPAYVVKGGKCEVDSVALDKLKTPSACTGVGGALTDGACKLPDKKPVPACRGVAGGTQTLVGDRCIFDTRIATSASGDYVGDYFDIVAVPRDDPDRFGGPPRTRLKVMSQKDLGPQDRMLTLLPVKPRGIEILKGAPEASGMTTEVKASDLIEYGAHRIGWTYGALAIPYKYYVQGKSFAPGVAIGPYVGRRWGRPGSAYTAALAATIGNVKGEVRNAENNIVSTPDLMAYSLATGVMWDISKAQGVKPFKIGVFVGVDSVSSDDVVKFKNNRKGWLALQIGFDFTDN